MGTLCAITYRLEAPGEVMAGDWLLSAAGSCYQVERAHELPPRDGVRRWKLMARRMGKRLPPHHVPSGLDRPQRDEGLPLDGRWWPLSWDRRRPGR